MPFSYDYTFNDARFTAAQITIPDRKRTGEITPTDLLTLWRDEPDTAVMVNSLSDGLAVMSLGDLTSITITRS